MLEFANPSPSLSTLNLMLKVPEAMSAAFGAIIFVRGASLITSIYSALIGE